jgi:hypothetical protein
MTYCFGGSSASGSTNRWGLTVFAENRDPLLTTDMSRRAMAGILAHREVAPLLSDDHVSVDGAPVEA